MNHKHHRNSNKSNERRYDCFVTWDLCSRYIEKSEPPIAHRRIVVDEVFFVSPIDSEPNPHEVVHVQHLLIATCSPFYIALKEELGEILPRLECMCQVGAMNSVDFLCRTVLSMKMCGKEFVHVLEGFCVIYLIVFLREKVRLKKCNNAALMVRNVKRSVFAIFVQPLFFTNSFS